MSSSHFATEYHPEVYQMVYNNFVNPSQQRLPSCGSRMFIELTLATEEINDILAYRQSTSLDPCIMDIAREIRAISSRPQVAVLAKREGRCSSCCKIFRIARNFFKEIYDIISLTSASKKSYF